MSRNARDRRVTTAATQGTARADGEGGAGRLRIDGSIPHAGAGLRNDRAEPEEMACWR